MSVSLLDVLAAPSLCGVIQGTKTGIPNVFPPGFYAIDKAVNKDTGEYTRVNGTRTTARIAAYGSPSRARNLKGLTVCPVKLLHAPEHINLNLPDFRGLLQKDSLVIDEKGVQEIGRQVRDARQNLDNLRVGALTEALFKGAIYFDDEGNLLPSSSGASITTDFAIPAGNKDQLNALGGGNIISASWATTSTDIHTHVVSLKQAAGRLTGYPLRHAFYGKNVPDMLVSNTTLKDFFVQNSMANTQFLSTGDIPNPLLGLSWHPAYEAFFEDADGNYQSPVGDNQVVFTPEPSVDWIGWLEGTVDIPTRLSVSSDAVEALSSVRSQQGMFAYATLETDPVRIKMVYGDTFLPVIKVPSAVFIATVAGF